MTTKNSGFTLIELMITLSIIAILCSIGYPAYVSHITHARRLQAEVALTHLSSQMEQYYTENNSYSRATLRKLKINKYLPDKMYLLQIDSATDDEFMISAAPQKSQAKHDTTCGTLSLNQTGDKQITGTGKIEDCWKS